MAFLQAGYIDGAQVKAEVLRRDLWASVGGASGIVTASSLQVVALGTPGAAVLIQPGSGIAQTRFPGAPDLQAYLLSNDAAYTLPVPANNTGSAVTWQVILRVRDPQYAGETTPADPLTNSYTIPELVAALPTGKAYLWLATITVPANTATITTAMILDRRTMAIERSKAEPLRVVTPTANSDMQWNPYGSWPQSGNIFRQIYQVPWWATRAGLVILINGIYAVGTAPVFGGVRLYFPQTGSATDHAIVYTEGTPNRITMNRGWDIIVPASLRGQSMTFEMQGMNSKGNPTILRADTQTQVTWQLTWTEGV